MLKPPVPEKNNKKMLKILPQLDVPFTNIIFLNQKVIIKTPAMCQVKIMQSTGDKYEWNTFQGVLHKLEV